MGAEGEGSVVERLAVEINANAKQSNTAIDNLLGKLGQLSGALSNMHKRNELMLLYEERRLSSITDVMTRLLNRRGLEEQLTPVWHRMCSRGEQAAFVYFDLDGLKVLRPGLHLGNVVRGRFEPAHALAMALRREEALRSISLPGTSPQAYAWFRGESLQTGETADLCDSSKSAETNSAGISRNENGIEDNNVSAAFIDNSPLGVSCSENVKNYKGWCLVTIDGCAAGWGKAGGNVIKNHYPKGLRKGSWYR